MEKIKKIIILFMVLLFACTKVQAQEAASSGVWINDLRNLFTSNKAIIFAINMRTFNADDKNKNGIIEEELGEKRGSFINAVDRLNELNIMGVNTILLMPITPTGKVKALGTAGSLYAPSSFNELNPQLGDKNSKLSLKEQAKTFIQEAHKKKLRVIVDLPSCGSYDLYMRSPQLFEKDQMGKPIVPSDWTDVRILNAGSQEQINSEAYNMYAEFIDMIMAIGADGVRASVATMKPYKFWQKLIKETRNRDPQFLFLAEASDSRSAVSSQTVYTPYYKLLEAGFDGYYGSYFNLKNWKKSKDLFNQVKFNQRLFKNYAEPKAVLGSFSTHDELSPVLINGTQFSKMIIWLNATLPVNSYYVDGFELGAEYIYPWANKKAPKTYTDDEYYFTHRGKMDIFNFSAKPMGTHGDVLKDFVLSNKFKNYAQDLIAYGDFIQFRTSSPSVFAYARYYNKQTVLVIGNLDFKKAQEVKVSIRKINNDLISVPVKMTSIPVISKGKIKTNLEPGEIQVMYFDNFKLK